MRWLTNARTKLIASFAAVAAMVGLVGYVGTSNMGQIKTMLDNTYARDMVGLTAAKDANIDLIDIGRAARGAPVETDKGKLDVLRQRAEERGPRMMRSIGELEKTLATAEGKALTQRIKDAYPDYFANIREAFARAAAGDKPGIMEALGKARAHADKMEEAMNTVGDLKMKLAEQAYKDAGEQYASARTQVLWIIGIAVGAGLLLGFSIAQWFAKALIEASVAAGEVASSAQQLASASEELSSGAQEQASSIEETSATLEEITATVKQNADNARQASQLAAGSRDAAEKGGQVVASAVEAMKEINDASKNIAEIITTIDEIAFQTNLLALNAAVEAARAGEQGRGFAVVAAEVRSLAQRSATAAKEIKRLIQDTVRKVENGSELVNRSGHTLNEIVASVKRVTDIVGEIAAASAEQATGIEQVNKATAQMDQVTQANSSQTEELSATAEELSGLAESLQEVVARFKLTEDEGKRPAAGRAKRAAAPHKAASSQHHASAGPVRHSHAAPSLAALSKATSDSSSEREPSAQDFEEFKL